MRSVNWLIDVSEFNASELSLEAYMASEFALQQLYTLKYDSSSNLTNLTLVCGSDITCARGTIDSQQTLLLTCNHAAQ
jgi:hypothetical protein